MQDRTQSPALQYPNTDDREAWKTYWKLQRQSWRTELEIDLERQRYLAERRKIIPDIEKGISPLKGFKLMRADVEWLLATHENGRGPVDWNDDHQRSRQGLDLRGADLREVNLHSLPLACTIGGLNRNEWIEATLEQRNMATIHMEGANLSQAHLEGSYFSKARLDGANFLRAHLESADLFEAHLEGANLTGTHLGGASLRRAFFDTATNIRRVTLGNEKLGFIKLAGLHWGDVDLSTIDWTHTKILGDESEALQRKRWDGEEKNKDERLEDYFLAMQANRQLAVVLQAQGLSEVATRFAYQAQKIERMVLWMQKKFGLFLFSLFLNLVAGYGYKLWRSFATYLFVIVSFATIYFFLGSIAKIPLSPLEAIVFSMTSFHGRGFSPGENIGLSNPLTILAAIEAFVGLIIEVTLIATLTQRFFRK